MAKKVIEKRYSSTDADLKYMYLCNKNDLAYVMQPIQGTRQYHIIKFQISNHLIVHTLIENEKKTEFTEYDASIKIMELYKQHAKRFI